MNIRTALPLLTLALTGACSGAFMETQMNYARQQIVDRDLFTLSVEASVLPSSIIGTVNADGCLPADSWATTATETDPVNVPGAPPVGDAEIPPWCDEFGLANALVTVRFGDQEVQVRTDSEGRFSITSGADLARLVSTGQSGTVLVQHGGQQATVDLAATGLGEAAALATLDAMLTPSLEDLAAFLRQFGGTPAAELAISRHHGIACGLAGRDATDAMRSGDLRRGQAVLQRYDEAYQQLFCSVCAPQCAALGGVAELVRELGGQP
jgi:hypothetical protein